MISKGFSAALLIVAALGRAAPALAETPADGWDLGKLMQGLQQVRISKARFVERRYLAVLTEPLESSGTLTYVAPDRLARITLLPKLERILVEGDMLTIDQGSEHRILKLRDYPEIGTLVESIRATLAGDEKTLDRLYTVTLDGNQSAWRLSLLPKQPKMQSLVKSIRIEGAGQSVRLIETLQGDGDRSEMTITDDPS